jgi:hypothetical protein
VLRNCIAYACVLFGTALLLWAGIASTASIRDVPLRALSEER